MQLNFDVRDNGNRLIGTTKIAFDWKGLGWAVVDDKFGAWKRVASRKIGKFEFKPWGVIWMLDGPHKPRVIVHDSPRGAMDMRAVRSTARLYEPVDPSLKDAHALWNLDLSLVSRSQLLNSQPLPFDRMAYIRRLDTLFPAPYDVANESSNYSVLTSRLKKTDPTVAATPNYTTCGSLPGFISRQVALSKGLKGKQMEDWVTRYGMEGTFRVRDTIGIPYGCWVEASKDKKPKAGDIYALLTRGKTDKRKDGISHVGVFECEIGNNWRTFDLGQEGGFDGKKNTREYKPATCELSGEILQGGGLRTVAGWVDLERYFRIG